MINTLQYITRILLLLVNFAGLAVYFYTIYYAFSNVGLFAAFFSAGLPGISSVYWMNSITMETGDLTNNYNLACVTVGITYALALLLMIILGGKEQAAGEEDEK